MKQTKQAGAAALPKSGYFAMVCILIAGSLWGCLGLFNRHLSALGIAPETVVMLRNLGACLILGLIFLVYDRSIFRIRLRHLPIFLCSGLISILFFTLCYFRSQFPLGDPVLPEKGGQDHHEGRGGVEQELLSLLWLAPV